MIKLVKVLHVIPSMAPVRGGPSSVVRTMARSLVQAGLAVDVVTTDDNGPDRLKVVNSKPVIENGVRYWYFRRQTRFYTFSWPLTRWLAQHVREYDLVHIHALFSYAAIPAAYLAKRCQVPYVVHPVGVLNHWGMHNRRPWLKRLSYCLIEKHILRGAAAIHYTSDQERLEAVNLGVKQKSVIIPEPTDAQVASGNSVHGQFRAQNGLDNCTILLFLSRLDPKKGLDILLPAFAQVKAQDSRAMLVIAGNGDPGFVEDLQEEADRLRIMSDIFWAGFLSGHEKWVAMADADVFVLPSYSENFGITVVEALASGLPVVISDQVPIHREVTDASAGLVVRCQVKELTEALLKLLQDASLRSAMASNGRRLAQTKFSPEAVTDRLITLYRDLC